MTSPNVSRTKWWHLRQQKLIGETVKVLLPGERLWVEVIGASDGKIRGRIINTPFHEFSEHEQAQFMKREFGDVEPLPKLHSFKKDDEVWFEMGTGNERGWLVPVEGKP